MNYQVSVPSAGGLDPQMLPFSGVASDNEGIVWNATSDVGAGNGNGMSFVAAPASYMC